MIAEASFKAVGHLILVNDAVNFPCSNSDLLISLENRGAPEISSRIRDGIYIGVSGKWRRLSNDAATDVWWRRSEIENFRFRCHVDQVGASIEGHIGVKEGLVKISVFSAGGADTYLYLVFDKIGQVVIGAVSGYRPDAAVFGFYGPVNSAVYEKEIDRVIFRVGDFGELKTSRRLFIVIGAKHKQEISHILTFSYFSEWKIDV